MVRPAQLTDIPRITKVYEDAFSGFFLTSLGTTFLKGYFECLMSNSETVMLVAEDEKEDIVGFALATTKSEGFNSRLIRQNRLKFSRMALNLLFRRPKALLRLMRNLTKKSDEVHDDVNYAELSSIGVATSRQNEGWGHKLLTEVENVLKTKGISRISLTTDYDNNEKAIGFYRGMGYGTLYVFTAYPSRKMYRLFKDI